MTIRTVVEPLHLSTHLSFSPLETLFAFLIIEPYKQESAGKG